MAGSSLLTLIDDIATLLDDISLMTKAATKKTASVLGDDLAVNAQQLTGMRADRELPVVWAVAKGSFKNKFILVPSALLISAFLPWLIVPLLVCGGLFLCYEGVEKIWHHFQHQQKQEEHENLVKAIQDESVDLVEHEKEKIKGAITTDFILSAEIIVITLGVVSAATLLTQVGVLVTVAIVITVSVYGLVAGIVKLDDVGLYLSQGQGEHLWAKLKRQFGLGLISFAPWLMKFLSVFGTIAMFMVGGGILTHNLESIHHLSTTVVHAVEAMSASGLLQSVTAIFVDIVIGILAGIIVVLIVSNGKNLIKSVRSNLS